MSFCRPLLLSSPWASKTNAPCRNPATPSRNPLTPCLASCPGVPANPTLSTKPSKMLSRQLLFAQLVPKPLPDSPRVAESVLKHGKYNVFAASATFNKGLQKVPKREPRWSQMDAFGTQVAPKQPPGTPGGTQTQTQAATGRRAELARSCQGTALHPNVPKNLKNCAHI